MAPFAVRPRRSRDSRDSPADGIFPRLTTVDLVSLRCLGNRTLKQRQTDNCLLPQSGDDGNGCGPPGEFRAERGRPLQDLPRRDPERPAEEDGVREDEDARRGVQADEGVVDPGADVGDELGVPEGPGRGVEGVSGRGNKTKSDALTR